jgi:hypothetical protein
VYPAVAARCRGRRTASPLYTNFRHLSRDTVKPSAMSESQ